MVNPVPSHPAITTPYLRRGRHWSCQRDAAGNGVHTGVDLGSPGINGARVVAARPGMVRHVNFGAAFGDRQVAITFTDGTVDFYAHMQSRVGAGTRVTAGQQIGTVGARGNATGPHLHFERHAAASGWSCANHRDPAASINWKPSAPPAAGWQIEGVLPMSATSIVYFTVNDGSGRICEARLLEGTWSHVPNPTVLTERRQSLDTSGIRWRDAGATNTARWGREVPWS